jgi:glycosyltransferase involved in cell wall biosynthesis
VDLLEPSAKRVGSEPRPYAVFVGALASWQGIDTVLDAVDGADWPPGVDLVVAGDGVERERVAVAALDNPHIRWLGSIPYMEAPALVSGSLVALVPMADVPRSNYGLSPLKLFEAMACGVPVVASDLPGLADIVRVHDCGITFPAGDPGALARSVAELSQDPARVREMGLRARAAAAALYSWDARAGQTEQVLVLAARRKRSGGGSSPC